VITTAAPVGLAGMNARIVGLAMPLMIRCGSLTGSLPSSLTVSVRLTPAEPGGVDGQSAYSVPWRSETMWSVALHRAAMSPPAGCLATTFGRTRSDDRAFAAWGPSSSSSRFEPTACAWRIPANAAIGVWNSPLQCSSHPYESSVALAGRGLPDRWAGVLAEARTTAIAQLL
jgi:hypothetical protein